MGLDNLSPTAAEIAEAKKVLASLNNKEKKSKLASLASFVKDNPVADMKLGERGPKRQEY